MPNCEVIPQINGKDSELFKNLLNYYNNRDIAKEVYTYAHSDSFLESYGDWINTPSLVKNTLDSQKEPLLEDVLKLYENEEKYELSKALETEQNPNAILIDQEQRKIKDLRRRISALRSDSFSNPENKLINNNVIRTIEERIAKVEANIETLKTTTSIQTLSNLAKSELDEIEFVYLENKKALDLIHLKYVDRVLNTWMAAGNFQNPHHIFLTDEEASDQAIIDEFYKHRNRAEMLAKQVADIKQAKLVEFVNSSLGTDFTINQLLEEVSDTSFSISRGLDLSKAKHPILIAIYKTIKSQNLHAKQSSEEVWKKIERVIDKALPILKTMNSSDPFKLFRQVDKNGYETGKLIFRYSAEFMNTSKELRENAFGSNGNKQNIKVWRKWRDKNIIEFDPRILFPDTSEYLDKYVYKEKTFSEEDREILISELKSILGEKAFNDYLDRAEQKIIRFQKEREIFYNQIRDKHSQEEIDSLMKDWSLQESPYWYMHGLEDPAIYSRVEKGKMVFLKGIKGQRRLYEVPKRVVDVKETEWYDKNFEIIEKTPELLELHTLAIDILKDIKNLLPYGQAKEMGINSWPIIEKTIYDLFSEKGVRMGFAPIYDNLVELSRTAHNTDIAITFSDPISKKVDKTIQTHVITENDKVINDYVKYKENDYRINTGKVATSVQIDQWRTEAIDREAKKKSFDMEKVLKSYYLLGMSYKHKAMVEDIISLAADTFKTIKRIQENTEGVRQQTPNQNLVADERGLTKMIEMMEYYIDTKLYQLPTMKEEGSFKKIYTLEEKKKQKEIDILLENLETKKESLSAGEYTARKNELLELKENLGARGSWAKIGNHFLKWNQLKGLAWNLTAGFANVGFGFISNIIESSGNRYFTQSNMMRAYSMLLNSIGAFYSGNTIKGPTARKIRNLMDKLDILGEAQYEIFEKKTTSTLTRKFKRIGPYSFNKRGEYINQGAVLLSVLLSDKFKMQSKSGTESTLYDALTEEGELKEEFDTEENRKIWSAPNEPGITNLKIGVNQLIKKIHGNYDPDSPMLAKQTLLGRALMQFRTWAIEGIYNRWGGEVPDYLLGGRIKGRYRSFYNKAIADATNMTGLEIALFNVKQLCRKALGFKTQYEEAGFSEVDAENMRKNLTEISLYIALMMLGLGLKMFGDDDDEEKPFKFALYNYFVNIGNRFQTDILFYSSPMEAEKLVQSIIPVMSLVTDVTRWFDAVGRQFSEDTRDIQSGPMEGMNWLFRRTLEITPGGASVIKVKKQISGVQKSKQ